jgi:hypothetical protein
MPPGHALYPKGLTREQIEQYVKQHPEDKAAIYDPYTVVERRGDRLGGRAVSRSLQGSHRAMSQALREAAALSDDAAFARFLRCAPMPCSPTTIMPVTSPGWSWITLSST